MTFFYRFPRLWRSSRRRSAEEDRAMLAARTRLTALAAAAGRTEAPPPPAAPDAPDAPAPAPAPGETANRVAGVCSGDAMLARKRAIRQGFNATQPVSSARDLHGRNGQMQLLTEGVLDRGNHALIFGARGSGKTSLTRVFANIADDQGYVVLYAACEPNQSFAELMSPFVSAVPPHCFDTPPTPAGSGPLPAGATPRDAVERLSGCTRARVLFILDEFDRIADIRVQHDVAAFMKMLTDAHLPVQIVAVGIASGLSRMIEGHPSLRRHLSPVFVRRIATRAVDAIIDRGAGTAGLTFTEGSREIVRSISCGSPYHVRLFCSLACLEAIRHDLAEVDRAAVLAAFRRAIRDWALTSEEDADLFQTLVGDGGCPRPVLEAAARMAADRDALSRQAMLDACGPAADAVLARLAPALASDPDDPDLLVFRDTLAPQFLLALLATAQPDHAPLRLHEDPDDDRADAEIAPAATAVSAFPPVARPIPLH